ncbi:FUSC family protein [Luteibacter sp. CQ10]|uniref:FUSC family protein n=1 Tax=Luteibacter sp. CQ10 TaxID=2805821 RepID=UPI0034A1BC1E
MSERPVPPNDPAVRRLRRAQAALDRMLRALPAGKRARVGAFMAAKTMVSACVAYGLGQFVHPHEAFWAAISAIAVTQPHFGDTRGAGRDRVLGTAFGAVAGLLGLWVGGSGEFVAFAVALFGVTVASWTVSDGAAARVGGITTAIVMLVPAAGPRWEVAAYRLGEVVLGTLCALVVGWLVARLEDRVERDAGP